MRAWPSAMLELSILVVRFWASLPGVGQVLNFSRSLQVKGDKSLQIVLKSDSPAGDFPVGKLSMLFLVLVGFGLVRAVAPKNA